MQSQVSLFKFNSVIGEPDSPEAERMRGGKRPGVS